MVAISLEQNCGLSVLVVWFVEVIHASDAIMWVDVLVML